MRKNVLLEAAARQGAACHQSVCRARRLLSADTQPNVINELDETIRYLETSVAEIEDVLRTIASIEDCQHRCAVYLETLRQAMSDLEELDRIELGTLRDAESYAETAQEHLGFLVSGYRCRSTED